MNALERATGTSSDEKTKVENAAKTDHHNSTTTNHPHHPPPPQLPPKPVRELARVLFPYTAEHEDELELREGDIITVLCKELEDKGWWKGELAGNVGVFPDNFVELLSSEEVAKPPRPEKPAAVLAKKGSPSSSADSTPTSTLNKSGKEPLPSPIEKEPPPPLPEKKVSAPPPPEKKPTSQASHSVSEPHEGAPQPHHTISHPAMPKNTKKTALKEDGSSLILDTDGEKLTHVTQNRPKGPSHRRPPSGLFKENDTPSQANGELSRSPSVPALNQPAHSRQAEVRIRPETSPRPDANPPVPWLQELGLKQKHKRLSGIIIPEGESSPPSAPAVSPKPAAKPAKPTVETTSTNMHVTNTATPTPKSKPSETPRLPTPDYEHKPFTPQPPPSKNKPLPAIPQPTESKRTALPSQDTKKLAPTPPSKESKKPVSTDSTAQVEDRIDALYKELLPKIRSLEERVEEQRKEQNRKMQSLMKELDDERKRRACMEVEVERLRKLVDAYAQV
ncbi:SH3 domain-containing kinase-binding protein 1-like isoform X4 [Scylla paramamosain]